MLQAYVLIQTEAGTATKARSEIGSVPGVRLAQSVTGPYDLVAVMDDPALPPVPVSRT